MTDIQKESVLVWLRLDLRLGDHPALAAAVASGLAVIPVFVWGPDERMGAPARWWLHSSLIRLDESLREKGSRLVIRRGLAANALLALAEEVGAQRVFFNRVYEPAALRVEAEVAAQLKRKGIAVEGFNGSLLFEPGTVKTTSGGAFQVFTPFWRAVWNERGGLRKSLKAPGAIAAPAQWPASLAVAELELEPKIDWAAEVRAAWVPGEKAAQARLKWFLKGPVADYQAERDRPDHDGTSRLSPHLHFGDVSVVQAWHAAADTPNAEVYLRQLAWREFAYHVLHAYPESPVEPIHGQFRNFPWRRNQRRLRAWQTGQTGYPFVDAAMRQLWSTGWMHNRARMVVASFLVKHLLIPWQDGADWFMDTLVDADLANNTMGWQWVAGCGMDAAPYFRVFNPILQGKKFDPDGEYVRRWVPELRGLPAELIHEPWAAPPLVLAGAGVRLGENYPRPLVDHAEARQLALGAFAEMQAGR